ncbi:MAG: peptidoglycan recognition protein family protein [Sarcina sp.]
MPNGKPIERHEIKYGHPNKSLDSVDYIVVHSTSNIDSTALNHVKWLNSDHKSNATHFYADSSKIVQTLDLDQVSWSVGNGGNGVTNSNHISLEICQSSQMKYQLKAIENARMLIDILQEMYPSAKVVFHHDVTSKNCPEIAFGDNPLFTEKELKKLLDF